YSSDSGSTWSSTTPFANYTHNIASSADGSKLFVTTAYYTDTPIYVSTNSGVSWSTPASAYQMSHITASSDGSKIATGNYDAIIVSTDTGSSWTDMNTGSDYPNGDYMAVDMSDNSSVLLASSGSSSPNYLYVSNNMGSNWTKLSSGPTSVFGSDDIAVSGNGNIFYVISRPDSGSNDNFVYKSSNNGASWSQLTIPGANLPLVAVNTSNDGSVVVAASNNGYVYTSSNGGASWTENSSIGSRYWTDVAVSSDGSKIVAVADGIVYTGVYGP
ncbi:MAG TPA: sialidase family protein, partial [Candidatus Saccharibacteria bacterium]|nr:sialidase family protein [Candidatus Saccharibacteria bacterium]